MENKMKEVTKEVIDTLQEAEVRTIMATGDNVLTAVSVAGQCGIVDAQKQVWLGDLAEDDQTREKFIMWQSLNQEQGKMNIDASNDSIDEESK